MNTLRINALFLFVVTVLLLRAGSLYSQTNAKKESAQTAAEVNDKPVAYWMNRLSHAKFSERERASAELAKAGFKAVKLLQQQAKNKDLEAALRAVTVLGAIYNQAATEDDSKSFLATESALMKIAFTRQRTVSASADALLKNHSETRKKYALHKIEKLGGIVIWLKNESGRADFPEAQEQQQVSSILLGRKWKGDDASLQLFHRIPQLRSLMISGKGNKSPLSEKGIAYLERSFPQLSIQYRGSACLGVRGYDSTQMGRLGLPAGPPGCSVTFVKPGSAADNGGLATGDIITQFGKNPVSNFQMLIDAIANHDPGEKITTQIQRGGVAKTLEITLQEWKR